MSIEVLIKSASEYLSDLDQDRLRSAYTFAEMAHEGQIRKDGVTPYIEHPLSAAYILTQLRVDEDTLIACLLHDVPEDTEYTLDDVEERFGKNVRFLVEGITKLSKVHFRNDMEARQIESLKKLFIHSAQDPRTILIKLADRLHNMSTLDAIPSQEKRERIARETLEIYVPIANLLGIWELKSKLEDYCFKAIHPNDYNYIQELIDNSDLKKHHLLEKSALAVKEILDSKEIPFIEIVGRQKSSFSIYQKMLKGRSFNQIYDFVGLRIVVSDIDSCYKTLGAIHQNFTPKIGRLKDYIAVPKNNGYQSIHTTVFGIEGTLTEIQIRTYDMHLENEYGVAAHYFYRQQKGSEKIKERLSKKYNWVERILQMQMEAKDNDKFLKGLKLDFFKDRIFVFTPKGDVIDLPSDATVIDFAFHVHTDIGRQAEYAILNGKKVPLGTFLKNGDVLEIHTNEHSAGPQVEWLDAVRTNLAKNKIREYLKEKDRSLLVESARSVLDSKLKMFGLEGLSHLAQQHVEKIIQYFDIESLDQLLTEIGNGNIDPSEVVQVIYSETDILGEALDPVHGEVYEREVGRLDKKVRMVIIQVNVDDRIGLLVDIATIFSKTGVNIIRMSSEVEEASNTSQIRFQAEFKDLEQYERLIDMLKTVHGVRSIDRLHSFELNLKDQGDSHKMPAQ